MAAGRGRCPRLRASPKEDYNDVQAIAEAAHGAHVKTLEQQRASGSGLESCVEPINDLRRVADADTLICYDASGQLKAQQSSNQRGGHGSDSFSCPSFDGSSLAAPSVSGWTTMAYDRLGRLTSRRTPEYLTSWDYDTPASNSVTPCGASIGKLCRTTGNLPTLGAGVTSPTHVTTIAVARLEYWHKDHLGSTLALTNHQGVVTARYSYDPFGKRRNVSGTYDAFGTLVIDFSADPAIPGNDRGYTGHEHLDDVGLIHMNGRVFDPTIGRFMQADPFIQDPFNLQNYDRYGYCFNNPATCTDPSGLIFKKIAKVWREEIWRSTIGRAVIAVGVTYLTAGRGAAMLGPAGLTSLAATTGFSAATVAAAANGAVAGFMSTLASTGGDMKAALRAGVAGTITNAAFAGKNALGRMVGSGVNGYLQTGTSKGFARGFAAGAIPNDLGFSDAFRNSPAANIGIGIARDGLRGAIIGGRNAVGRGIAYGQINNAIGHLAGSMTGTYKGFKDGAFYYERDFYDKPITVSGGQKIAPAVTIGNVIGGPNGIMTDPNYSLLNRHERNHISQPGEQALGALYLPAHIIDMSIGALGRWLTGSTRWYALEEHMQNCPYSALENGRTSDCR